VGQKRFVSRGLFVGTQLFLYVKSSELNCVRRADDPWSQTGRDNTPFDQAFYLILNVAVGGTGGYFPYASRPSSFKSIDVVFCPFSIANLHLRDFEGGKPWVDGDSATAARDFWEANSTWLQTWGAGEARGMTVQSVKMWQQDACP